MSQGVFKTCNSSLHQPDPGLPNTNESINVPSLARELVSRRLYNLFDRIYIPHVKGTNGNSA